MRSSYPISLFSRPPQKESGPSAFVVSFVLHSLLFGVLFITIKGAELAPRVLPNRKYQVRLLDVQRTAPSITWYPQHPVHRVHTVSRRSFRAGGRRGVAPKVQVARVPSNFATPKPAPQTLIQPQVPPEQQTLAEVKVPHAMVWTPGRVLQKKIVTPKPQPLSAMLAKPSLRPPNVELNPSDVSLTSTPFQTKAPMPAPGTTIPVRVNSPNPAKQLPETASKTNQQLSPARVISVSNLKVQDGTAALPVINEIAQADTIGAPALGQVAGQSAAGKDSSNNRDDGKDVGQGAKEAGDLSGGVTVDDGSNPTPDSASDSGVTVATGGGSSASGEMGATQHIAMPKGGQYGMVVVGASPEEDYPETADLWSGRLVYTVYLQTNTPQNWILQYSIPKVPNDPPSDGTLAAPWPFDLMRPALKYRDVILVHGFVNTKGQFEKLSIAYPPGLAEASLLLRELKKWVFRPAALNGQPTRVEVLLIIPGVDD
ncbi:MAG: hypothetical protein ACRD3F_07100 [Acidobacteriaceae bacterium]